MLGSLGPPDHEIDEPFASVAMNLAGQRRLGARSRSNDRTQKRAAGGKNEANEISITPERVSITSLMVIDAWQGGS